MKTAAQLILIFDDVDGAFATAITDGFQSDLEISKDSFDLSLDRYGIKDTKASGNITHFVDSTGVPQVKGAGNDVIDLTCR